jgi:Type 9 secretion system plug protein 1st domain
MKFRIKILIIFLFCTTNIKAIFFNDSIDYYYEEYIRQYSFVYDSLIKTARCYKSGWELSLPIILLDSDEKIYIEFDDLKNEIRDFYYEIKHCDADWEVSKLMEYEYIEGFNLNPITNYNYSFNTTVPYIHYNFEIPNNDVQLKKSGNYLLFVYDSYEKEHLVFTKEFRIVEPIVAIEASAHQAKIIDYLMTSHEVDFTVDLGHMVVHDPYSDIKVTVLQNNRRDNILNNLKPLFIKDNLLIYDYDRENIFNGLSEFRNFDIKSIRYQSERIARVDYEKNVHHVYLYGDEKRTFKRYFNEQDINGKHTIEIQEADNPNIEADYVWVHFTLYFEQPALTGNLYVTGALFDWNYTEENRMTYNFDKKVYELKVLIKQGYYNYMYAFLEDNNHVADITFIEGNHYETENDYIIYVYKRDMIDNYDKLIGYKIVNSNRK